MQDVLAGGCNVPMPKRMPISNRVVLAWHILLGRYNQVGKVQTRLLEEITLRNRNKEWYQKRDEGKFPFLDPEDDDDP